MNDLSLQHIRTNENLDRIWISNPHLIREIQSSKFFPLVCTSLVVLQLTLSSLLSSTATPYQSTVDRLLHSNSVGPWCNRDDPVIPRARINCVASIDLSTGRCDWKVKRSERSHMPVNGWCERSFAAWMFKEWDWTLSMICKIVQLRNSIWISAEKFSNFFRYAIVF